MNLLRPGVCRTARHTTFYFEAGPTDGPLLVFLHGWPSRALSWRAQLHCFAAMGFRTIAPDMRGYGRSSIPSEVQRYALAEIVQDMVELVGTLNRRSAVWIGHDWGAPVVWGLATHHPEICQAVVGMCVPFLPNGFAPVNLVPLVNRNLYPLETFPAGQWDYQLYFQTHFEEATTSLRADTRRTLRALMRSGSPSARGVPAATASVSTQGGWFGGKGKAPDLPLDLAVMSESELDEAVAELDLGGFYGPNAWYANADRNLSFAAASQSRSIDLPTLFIHAAYDAICDTSSSELAEPMRKACTSLSEATIQGGHWIYQEKSHRVNECLARWLFAETPA